MKKTAVISGLALLLLALGCRFENGNYSRALFKHIPDDPELLVLVKPNDVSKLAEVAMNELDLQKIFGNTLELDTTDWQQFQDTAVKMLEALGIPWPQIENVGLLLYYKKPIILATGVFNKIDVETNMQTLGFKYNDNGFFDYVYSGQKLSVPEDGVIMLAAEELLEDLQMVPEEHRLWNRADFSEYRLTSPLDNSVFIWSHPPDHFLSDFPHREDLGDLSLAMDFKSSLNMKLTVRVKDPQKTVFLYDIIFGTIGVAKGLLGSDPDYGPLFNGFQVSQDNRQVVTSVVLPYSRLEALKERFKKDFEAKDNSSFKKVRSFLDAFK